MVRQIPLILYQASGGAYLFQTHLKGGGGLNRDGGLIEMWAYLRGGGDQSTGSITVVINLYSLSFISEE